MTPFQSLKPHPHTTAYEDEEHLEKLFDPNYQLEREEALITERRQSEDSLRAKIAALNGRESVRGEIVRGEGGDTGEDVREGEEERTEEEGEESSVLESTNYCTCTHKCTLYTCTCTLYMYMYIPYIALTFRGT